jgi:four helix bundle protein
MSIQGLQRLEVWRKAKDFAVIIHQQVLPLLPPEEKWSANQQLRRSAQSIAANLAEGYGRYYYQENIRFCYMARGSVEETLSHLVLCHELGYIPDSLYEQLQKEGESQDRLINGYIAYLKRSKQGANEPGAEHTIHESEDSYLTDLPDEVS